VWETLYFKFVFYNYFMLSCRFTAPDKKEIAAFARVYSGPISGKYYLVYGKRMGWNLGPGTRKC
jgi:hypothetical protein